MEPQNNDNNNNNNDTIVSIQAKKKGPARYEPKIEVGEFEKGVKADFLLYEDNNVEYWIDVAAPNDLPEGEFKIEFRFEISREDQVEVIDNIQPQIGKTKAGKQLSIELDKTPLTNINSTDNRKKVHKNIARKKMKGLWTLIFSHSQLHFAFKTTCKVYGKKCLEQHRKKGNLQQRESLVLEHIPLNPPVQQCVIIHEWNHQSNATELQVLECPNSNPTNVEPEEASFVRSGSRKRDREQDDYALDSKRVRTTDFPSHEIYDKEFDIPNFSGETHDDGFDKFDFYFGANYFDNLFNLDNMLSSLCRWTPHPTLGCCMGSIMVPNQGYSISAALLSSWSPLLKLPIPTLLRSFKHTFFQKKFIYFACLILAMTYLFIKLLIRCPSTIKSKKNLIQ